MKFTTCDETYLAFHLSLVNPNKWEENDGFSYSVRGRVYLLVHPEHPEVLEKKSQHEFTENNEPYHCRLGSHVRLVDQRYLMVLEDLVHQ